MSNTQRAEALIIMIKKCYKGNLLRKERHRLSNIKKELKKLPKEGKINTHMIDNLSMEIYQILG